MQECVHVLAHKIADLVSRQSKFPTSSSTLLADRDDVPTAASFSAQKWCCF